MTTPTPGPWFTSDRAERPRESAVSVMVLVDGQQVSAAECWVREGIPLEAAQANARQIAASSEAIAFIREVFTNEEPRTVLPFWMLDRARTILRQVDGKPPLVFGKWVAGRDEEHFQGPEYDTKEAAVAGAPAALKLEPGQHFWVGQTSDPLLHPEGPGAFEPEVVHSVDDTTEHKAPSACASCSALYEDREDGVDSCLCDKCRREGTQELLRDLAPVLDAAEGNS